MDTPIEEYLTKEKYTDLQNAARRHREKLLEQFKEGKLDISTNPLYITSSADAITGIQSFLNIIDNESNLPLSAEDARTILGHTGNFSQGDKERRNYFGNELISYLEEVSSTKALPGFNTSSVGLDTFPIDAGHLIKNIMNDTLEDNTIDQLAQASKVADKKTTFIARLVLMKTMSEVAKETKEATEKDSTKEEQLLQKRISLAGKVMGLYSVDKLRKCYPFKYRIEEHPENKGAYYLYDEISGQARNVTKQEYQEINDADKKIADNTKEIENTKTRLDFLYKDYDSIKKIKKSEKDLSEVYNLGNELSNVYSGIEDQQKELNELSAAGAELIKKKDGIMQSKIDDISQSVTGELKKSINELAEVDKEIHIVQAMKKAGLKSPYRHPKLMNALKTTSSKVTTQESIGFLLMDDMRWKARGAKIQDIPRNIINTTNKWATQLSNRKQRSDNREKKR